MERWKGEISWLRATRSSGKGVGIGVLMTRRMESEGRNDRTQSQEIYIYDNHMRDEVNGSWEFNI